MKSKKISLIFIFALLFILVGFTKVNAASVNLNVPTNVTAGETIVASITGKSEQWNLTLTANGNKIAETNNLTNEGSEISISKNATYKTTESGTVTFILKGDYSYTSENTVKTREVNISKIVTINEKVEKKEEPTPTPTPKETPATTAEPTPTTQKNTISSDATLKNLGITPNDFRGFRPGILSYNVEVPNETSKINIYAEKNNSKATVTGTGAKTLQIGNNTFSVTVTAEDKKTTRTYTLNINRKKEAEISNDATLKNLGITPNDFRGFRPGILSYNVDVPKETSQINIYAEKNNAKATVTGIGTKTLEIGQNKFEVTVTAEDKKTTRTYTLNINRKEEDDKKTDEKNETDTSNVNKNAVGLTNIEVTGFSISPEFKNDVYEYSIDATDETKNLDIQTKTSSDKIEVEIVGNSDLKLGENIITILVRNKDDDSTTTYQLLVNCKQADVDVSIYNNMMNNAQDRLKKQGMIIDLTVVAIVVLLIVFLVQRYRLKNKDDEDYFNESENQRREDEDLKPKALRKNVEEEKDLTETNEENDEEKIKKVHAKGKRYK